MKLLICIFTIWIFLIGSSCWAVEARPLGFTTWKATQINMARNRSIRILNQITLVRQSTGNLNKIKRLEGSLRVSDQNIDLAQDLTVEDYFNFYLTRFVNRDSALLSAAHSMTRNQMAMLLKSLLKNRLKTARAEPPSSTLMNFSGRQNL